MKYLVRLNNIQAKNKNFKKELDNIDNVLIKLETIKKESTWSGEGSKIFFKQYDEYYNQVNDIKNKLILMIDYFNKYYDNYDEEFEKVKNRFEVDDNETNRY